MMGYIFTTVECIISLKAKLQDTVVLSIAEEEYIAADEAFKKAM